MKKFEYDAKTSSVRGMIKDLNQWINTFNKLKTDVDAYIEQLSGDRFSNKDAFDEAVETIDKFNNTYAEAAFIIPDRLLTLKDDMISKMIITDDNIAGVLYDFSSDFGQELVDIEGKLIELRRLFTKMSGIK